MTLYKVTDSGETKDTKPVNEVVHDNIFMTNVHIFRLITIKQQRSMDKMLLFSRNPSYRALEELMIGRCFQLLVHHKPAEEIF